MHDVEIIYPDLRGYHEKLKVTPLKLVFEEGGPWWVMIAYDYRSGENRRFRVDKIKSWREIKL